MTTHLFYKEEIDADECNHIWQKHVESSPSKYTYFTTYNTYSHTTVDVFVWYKCYY
jgi:hypothetical protein